MNYLVTLDLLMNQPSILKELTDITILTRDMDRVYALANDRYRDNINKIKAERAIRVVTEVYKNIFFSPKKDIDEYIQSLGSTSERENLIIITNNVVFWAIADYYQVKIQKYQTVATDYSGVRTITLDFDENDYNVGLDNLLQKTDWTEEEMYENEFLIVYRKQYDLKEKDNSIRDLERLHSIYRFNNNRLVPLSLTQQQIKNPYDSIKPRNPEQIALFNLLRDEKISILLATGPFGTGKTFCLKNYALEMLEKGKINKIVYVPNNSFNEDTRDIGALPGELFDKELIHLGSWIDLIGYDRLKSYVDESKIELVPISIARGRSFDRSIIIVNEAQNLTDKHIKLLIGRCGEGTRIFFDGDIKQADSDTFRDRSGLRLLTKLRFSDKFSPIFGMVRLNNIERSLTAQASAYLDEIE